MTAAYQYVDGPNMSWSGTWEYVSVKYAGYVDLFYIDGLSSFDWSSSLSTDVQQGFSHARLWNQTSVPEPATMFLLGTGMIGLAVLGRKKFKKLILSTYK